MEYGANVVLLWLGVKGLTISLKTKACLGEIHECRFAQYQIHHVMESSQFVYSREDLTVKGTGHVAVQVKAKGQVFALPFHRPQKLTLYKTNMQ